MKLALISKSQNKKVNLGKKRSIPYYSPSTVSFTEGARFKLKVGEPDDAFEQEADQVANAVMQIPDSAVKETMETRFQSSLGSPSMQNFQLSTLTRPLMTSSQIPSLRHSTRQQTDSPRLQRLCSKCEESLPSEPHQGEVETILQRTKDNPESFSA